jgi:APA family basic amino acid/polyamine antiporter
VTPLSGRDGEQYEVAGIMIGVGVVLWVITWFINRGFYAERTYVKDPADLE